MRKLTIDERDFASRDELMDFLARELDVPGYFGGILPALLDCLGDIAEPTRFKVRRRTPDAGSWFERVSIALLRAACSNESLSVRVEAK